jgi:hypothetical protein
MKVAELKRLKEFYHQATADQQCALRNLIATHYYNDGIFPLFAELSITGEDFCEGEIVYNEIPDPIWQLLANDATVESVEDFAATEVLWWHDNVIKSQKKDQQFADSVDFLLRDLRNKLFAAGADIKQLKEIDSQINAEIKQGETNTPPRNFNFQEITDRIFQYLPILDKKKFLEAAHVLIKMREGEMMFGMGKAERGRN